MAEQTLTVKIIGDEKDLLRAFRSSTQATQRFSASFGTFLKGAVIFEGVRAGFQAIGRAARAGASEFSEMQTVAAQTEAVLKSTGGAANVTAEQVEALATRLSRLSGTDDEAIASAENLILTFKNVRNEVGKGNRIFDRAAAAALDLSKAAGGAFGSLDNTAKQLGKALNDPVRGMTALARAGVTFSDKQRKTIKELVETNRTLDAQRLILREVESQVGGSAKAFGDTLPGALAKIREGFRNAFGNLVAVVAEPLAGALSAFANFIPKIEAGVERISETVGPALSNLVSTFTDKLPQLERIVTSILDPLREHVAPILVEFGAIAQRVWANVVEVFDRNRESLGQILDNLGTVLANVWTIARPTIVFLFEKALPAALNIAIPVIEKLTGITRFMSDVFVKSVRVIIGAIDAFLGGLAKVADAASHLPFIGDHFTGIADKINAARDGLREFSGDLDRLNGRKVTVEVAVVHGSEGRAPGREPPKEKDDPAAKVVKSLERSTAGSKQIATAAKAAESAADRAAKAAAKQRSAFDELMERIGLRRERAEETRGLEDDIAVAKKTERALREQIEAEGRTTELLGRLAESEREQRRLIQQRRQGRQFEELGLSAEGDRRVPGVGALRKRLGNLQEQVKGSVLDTKKTRSQLAAIARILRGDFGKVGKDVRSTILQMFNDIAGALNDGAKSLSGPLTKTTSLNTKKFLAGLGLSEDELNALRGRLSSFNSAGAAPGGFQTAGPGGGFAGAPIVVQSNVTVTLDGKKVGQAVTREQQKGRRRNPRQKRGPNRRGGEG